MMDDFSQFKMTYITECLELLADMEEKLMNLGESASKDDLNAIFRCAHSIKGGAGAFGFTNIASFTHVLEALLDKMREGKLDVSQDVIDVLLKARDVVMAMIVAARDGTTLADDYGNDILEALQKFDPSSAGHAPASKVGGAAAVQVAGPKTYEISFKPHASMIAHGNEPLLLLRELAGLGTAQIVCVTGKVPDLQGLEAEECYLSWMINLTTEKSEKAIKEVFEFVEDECELKINALDGGEITPPKTVEPEKSTEPQPTATSAPPASIAAAKPAGGAAAPATAAQATPSIRVDVDKVDRLINMVGEVVITQAFLSAQANKLVSGDFADLVRSVDEMMHHTRELQEAVMAIRMQPVKSIFSRMPRLVRDLSGQLGKDIVLEMHGENTEVDKTIIEQLSDPLTHMIRNSVDHGVEKPDVRESRGKPRRGTVTLSAEHRGGRIVIEIGDDGGGINREKVLAKAKEKGVVAPDANLTDSEIDLLIFAPGFSTADAVTNVSGRGVGMDVVRRNIEAIGGTVSIYNTPGQGATIAISLPLTLAILDGMIVRVGTECYIVPINSIIETMRPKADEVKRIADGNCVINVRGEFVPVIFLYQAFNVRSAIKDPSKGLVVLVESGNQIMGIVVDELVGQQQVVIKSLETNADPVEGISGATILGDGKVSLILDVMQLNRMNQSGKIRADDEEDTDTSLAHGIVNNHRQNAAVPA